VFATVIYRLAQLACYAVPVFLAFLVYEMIDASYKQSQRSDTNIALAMAFVVVLIVLGVVGGYGLKKALKVRVWFPFCRWMSARCYRRLWRPEIIGFLARSQGPYRSLVAYVGHTSNSVVARWDWVRYFVELDFALPVYSTAQRFVV
jgi:hypothetical protein